MIKKKTHTHIVLTLAATVSMREVEVVGGRGRLSEDDRGSSNWVTPQLLTIHPPPPPAPTPAPEKYTPHLQ